MRVSVFRSSAARCLFRLLSTLVVLVTTSVSAATHASAAAPSTGLVAAYNFDAGSGSTLVDQSGNGNTGTIRNASWTSGKNGKALAFDGSSSWVTVPDSTSLDLTSAMTLEAWVKPSSLGS